MKKLLTVILPEAVPEDGVPEQIELLNFDDVKRAKGKYAVVSECDLECDFGEDFFALLDNENADILQFENGYCIKTSLIKGCKSITDKFRTEIYAALSAKTVLKSTLSPLGFSSALRAEGEQITEAFTEFNKVKAKLPKEVYAFVFDLICGVAVGYYAQSLVEIYDKKLPADELAAFDEKLKENTVFYHTVEKRFNYLSLQKLRQKSFKMNFLDCIILKSKLKK